jgi:hypothetical protein
MLKHLFVVLSLTAPIQISVVQSAEPESANACLARKGSNAKIKCLVEVVVRLEERDKNNAKLDSSYRFFVPSRQHCLQWVDTGQPPNFGGCNNEPDQKFQLTLEPR